MPKLIAHRGNLYGPKTNLENKPNYVNHALSKGYDVVVDVWYENDSDKLYLGDGKHNYHVKIDFLKDERIWCHAMNIHALEYLLTQKCHVFYLDFGSPYTLTSRGYIWSSPGSIVTKNSICVLPELNNSGANNNLFFEDEENFIGLCSDYIAVLLS